MFNWPWSILKEWVFVRSTISIHLIILLAWTMVLWNDNITEWTSKQTFLDIINVLVSPSFKVKIGTILWNLWQSWRHSCLTFFSRLEKLFYLHTGIRLLVGHVIGSAMSNLMSFPLLGLQWLWYHLQSLDDMMNSFN